MKQTFIYLLNRGHTHVISPYSLVGEILNNSNNINYGCIKLKNKSIVILRKKLVFRGKDLKAKENPNQPTLN